MYGNVYNIVQYNVYNVRNSHVLDLRKKYLHFRNA